LNQNKQRLLLEYVISSPDLFAICDSVIDPRYFDADLRGAVALVKDYFREYKNLPDADIIAAETGVQLKQEPISRDKLEYCVVEVEKFCRQRAIVMAMNESADLLAQGDYGTIEAKFKAAVNLSVAKDLGVSLFDSPREILHRISQTERPISTGYDDLDKKLFGGLIRKQIMIISGPSGGGKSLFMNNIALNYAESGHHVLFVTLELSQDLNYLRLASMISGISQNGWFMNIEEIASRVENYQSIYGNGKNGNLYIKRMPMGTKPSQIRAVVKEYELVHGVPPDLLVVDYLDIMGCDVKVPVDNISLKDKYATEGLREVGVDNNMMVVTGSQLKKEAQGDVDVGASQMAGGQTKMNTADIWGSIILTDEMKAAGVVGIKLIKTRTSDGKEKVAFMEFDNSSLRIRNFTGPVNEVKLATFRTLVKKASTTKTKFNTPEQDPTPTPGSANARNVRSWIDELRGDDANEN
jgi:replicative DNA helicase